MEVSIGDFKIQDGQYIAIEDRWWTLGELRAIIQEWSKPKKKPLGQRINEWMSERDGIDPNLYDL